jgi:nucleotidyltransferase substrate binding protein (TIGR01987 family)
MESERFSQRLDDYSRALVRLGEALAAQDTDLALDASIQRFEFTFELAWKSMKLWLDQQGGQVVGTPKQTLGLALEAGLITDGNAWSNLLRNRNLTSHTYDEGLAVEVREYLRTEGLGLFQALEARLNLKSAL